MQISGKGSIMDANIYHLAKVLHIIALVSWMAGMFYLPRIFVYHTQTKHGSEADGLFQTMERKLLKYIMTPAMLVTWATGLWLAVITEAYQYGWFHGKMLCVLLMSGAHGLFAIHRKGFTYSTSEKTERYYRLINEIPTLLLIVIVWLVVFKPFAY
jgi:protoporphyrinogen IX oxidase